MAGTISGGKQAAATNKQKYGKDFYSKIGKLGGSNGRTGGFGSDKVGKDGMTGKQRASYYGAIGGRNSQRK